MYIYSFRKTAKSKKYPASSRTSRRMLAWSFFQRPFIFPSRWFLCRNRNFLSHGLQTVHDLNLRKEWTKISLFVPPFMRNHWNSIASSHRNPKFQVLSKEPIWEWGAYLITVSAPYQCYSRLISLLTLKIRAMSMLFLWLVTHITPKIPVHITITFHSQPYHC